MKRCMIVFALVVALGACKGGERDKGAGTAEGEILPGSTSDAMLPVDTVRSQAPLAPKVEGSGKSHDKVEAATSDVAPTEAAQASEAAAAPAAAPSGN